MPARLMFWLGAFALALASTAHAAVTISTDRTKNETCSGGVCTPTTGNANLNVGDLQTMLASSDVTVKTGAGAVAIGVIDPLTWASTHRLTLDSVQFVHIKAAVVVEGTGALTLTTNDGGTGGDLVFENGGTVSFWDLSSSLVVNGRGYTLVNDIASLAENIAAHPSHNYALSGDFDAGQDRRYAGSPVTTVFTGTFEGLGHEISNFTISTGKNQSKTGLFAELGSKGTLRDIALVNATVSAKQGAAGPLVAQNDGAIVNAYTTGSTFGSGQTGGLAGSSTGTIVTSYSTVTVGCAFGSAGGLVGAMQGGVIEHSYASGAVTCGDDGGAGGLVGGVSAGKILYSFATGQASSYGRNGNDTVFSGGLAAVNLGTIAFSFAAGDVSAFYSEGEDFGEAYAGGLTAINRGTIHDSYATGAVSGLIDIAGGLVEENDGSISRTYSTGHVHADEIGGLLGEDDSTTATSYWDLDTSGVDNPDQGAANPLNDPGITGLTDAQLKAGLPAAFNPAVWGQDPSINNGWPYLLANPPQQAPAKKRTRK